MTEIQKDGDKKPNKIQYIIKLVDDAYALPSDAIEEEHKDFVAIHDELVKKATWFDELKEIPAFLKPPVESTYERPVDHILTREKHYAETLLSDGSCIRTAVFMDYFDSIKLLNYVGCPIKRMLPSVLLHAVGRSDVLREKYWYTERTVVVATLTASEMAERIKQHKEAEEGEEWKKGEKP